MQGVTISGVGKALPKRCVNNDDLSTFLETSDEWIKTRTGIGSRYIAIEETTTSLAISAAQGALSDGNIDASTIDMIIVATISPDMMMPSTACMVQAAIGATNATAFDITAACSGFLYGSKIAIESIKANGSKRVLVIGAEVLSKVIDWTDRASCVLFGDGAGAVVYELGCNKTSPSIYTESDGTGGKYLTLPAKSTRSYFANQPEHPNVITMDGKEVYRFATTVVPDSIKKVLAISHDTLEDIDCYILHQANERIIDSVAKKLGIAKEKFFKNLQYYGNTSSASIPLALAEAKHQLKKGSKVVLAGFGGGLTWGSMVITID
ncbi:MAG: beta-ketoacyl-ACP synthase III [Cellulosilyticaceae bacterium]